MNETLHLWDQPVVVRIDGENLRIEGPAQARTLLLVDWPAERTDKHKIASDTCLAAMEGASPLPAWMAFIEAAIEADIFVE